MRCVKRPNMRELNKRTRGGQATLDYILVLGVVLPLAAVVMRLGPRIMGLVYEMFCMLIAWPFM